MLAPSLHALGRYGPHLRVEVHFIPIGMKHLGRAGGCQDAKFEGASGDTFPLTKLAHERRKLAVGHRRKMAHTARLASARQQLVEVPAPSRRVLTLAVASDGRPTQHALDARSHTRGRLLLAAPQGLD